MKNHEEHYCLYTSENETEEKRSFIHREKLAHRLGFDHIITLKQIHSDIIHPIHPGNIPEFINNPFIEGDGILTDMKNILIGVFTADCVPVIYSDEKSRVAGIVHAGWKGLENKIQTKMVSLINERFAIPPEEIKVQIGPHIRLCCYEVGDEFSGKFDNKHFRKKGGRYFLDMGSVMTEGLIKSGIKKENIRMSSECTKCGTEIPFFSYRNGETKGRNFSFIGFREKTEAPRH